MESVVCGAFWLGLFWCWHLLAIESLSKSARKGKLGMGWPVSVLHHFTHALLWQLSVLHNLIISYSDYPPPACTAFPLLHLPSFWYLSWKRL